MTDYVKVVDPNGGAGVDYSSLSAWVANESALYTGADNAIADVRRNGSTKDTTQCIVAGFVATPSIIANSSYRHEGVYADTRASDGNYVAVLEAAVSGDGVLKPHNSNLYVEGLLIGSTQTGAGNESAVRNNSAASGILFDACILRHLNGGRYVFRNDAASSITVRNTVVYGGSVGGVVSTNASSVTDLDNCTVIDSSTGIYNFSGTMTCRNCYAAATTGYSGTITKTTCASSDTTGSAGLQNIAYSTANFVNVTAGSEDLHLVTGSALRGVGTDLSGTFTNDIDGQTRSAWDVGADEFILSVPSLAAFTPSIYTIRRQKSC